MWQKSFRSLTDTTDNHLRRTQKILSTLQEEGLLSPEKSLAQYVADWEANVYFAHQVERRVGEMQARQRAFSRLRGRQLGLKRAERRPYHGPGPGPYRGPYGGPGRGNGSGL